MAINLPDDLFASPVDGIGVIFVVVSLVIVSSSTVVGTRVALSEVVGLDIEIVDPKPFPVNFVQVVRLQDCTADNTRSGSSLENAFDPSKHDVPLGLDQGSITLFGHSEPSTIFVVSGRANFREVVRTAITEIKLGRLSESWPGRAC